ncbi:MAG: hypothetical protein ABR94_04115 [Sphingobacteriales bacterium BACL12 MAG-120802-bin5]|nr:MAG: hypothetical protein ABR94_04115 [Sphingobacteriales bacterium BACL12 MAG-120802-bin5]
MSHEIRTPLNAINGMVQLMQGTPLNPKQREYMEAISTSGESLLHIINEILDFSKIEAGRMELEKHPFSIRKNVESLIATIRFKAEEKGLDLVLDMADDIPETLLGDGLRLNQILLNLVSNAIKFTAEGEVRVTTRLIDIIGAQARIFFSVKDTGIGIESEHLETIFDSFTQAATDTTRLYGGTGLGLAIVKKLVEILNGAIMVKSKLGEGSEFIFEVEMEVADAQNATEAPEKEGRTLKVKDLEARLLLAEDHPLNQLVTTEMLKGKWPSLEIEVAENGKQAIAMLEDKHYDLVLMDVQMPEMDGHTATRYIRSSMPAPTNELPILAFTAYATSGEAEKCLQAGMNDYVSKPVMAHILQDKIIDLLIAHPGFDNERIIFEKEASNTEQLNLNYLDAITDDDNDLKTRMLGIMLDETPIELKRLEEQAAAANWDGVRATAHKMKSTMQFLGLNDTLDQVKFIELSAREKVNLPEVHERIKKVTEVCNEVMEGIRLEIQRIK